MARRGVSMAGKALLLLAALAACVIPALTQQTEEITVRVCRRGVVPIRIRIRSQCTSLQRSARCRASCGPRPPPQTPGALGAASDRGMELGYEFGAHAACNAADNHPYRPVRSTATSWPHDQQLTSQGRRTTTESPGCLFWAAVGSGRSRGAIQAGRGYGVHVRTCSARWPRLARLRASGRA